MPMRSGASPMPLDRTTRVRGWASEKVLRRLPHRPQSGAMPGTETPIYSSPEIYEVAFGWELGRELDFYERCFRRHAKIPVRRLVEPCCGTGRMLEGFARRGYETVGYDRSVEMAAFADARLRPHG